MQSTASSYYIAQQMLCRTEVEHGAMSGAILAMPITLMTLEGIANGNMLQASRVKRGAVIL